MSKQLDNVASWIFLTAMCWDGLTSYPNYHTTWLIGAIISGCALLDALSDL